MKKKQELGRSDYGIKTEEIHWEETSESYDIERLYEIDSNNELIRLEMNTIEYPLFSKNRKLKKNTVVTYEFNNQKHQYLRIEPIVHKKIPGELEEKIFFALMKLYKKNGHNQTIYTDFPTLIHEMRVDKSGKIKNMVREGLKVLGGSTYEFNNLFYSNENRGILNTNLRTSMFSILVITLTEAKEINNPDLLKHFRNSKVREIIQIRFSQHFFDNIIKKGYLYFDRQDLLQIENPVSRTLFMMLTKWRNKELYIKRFSKFLASRIPLSWKKTNISRTLQTMEQAFEDLKAKKVIKSYRFNCEKGRDNSYFEIWFDEIHNKKYNGEIDQIRLPGELESFEITNEIKESLDNDDIFIVESEITKQVKELLSLMPEKARALKTLEGKIEKALKKKGYDYTKGAVLYTAKNAKASFGKYLTETLEKNWHEEFQQSLIQEEKEQEAREKKAEKIKKKQQKEKSEGDKKQEIRDRVKELFNNLSAEKKSELEKLALEEYISHGETPEIRKSLKDFFQKMKLGLTLEYLIKTDYFSNLKDELKDKKIEKRSVFDEEKSFQKEIEPAQIVQEKKEKNQLKSKNIIQIEKLYEDMISLKVELHDYLYDKVSEQTLRQVMSFLNIEAHYRREVEGYKLEIKYVENGKSLIYIEKLN